MVDWMQQCSSLEASPPPTPPFAHAPGRAVFQESFRAGVLHRDFFVIGASRPEQSASDPSGNT